MRCEARYLEIQEGGQANLEYLRVHFGDVPEPERRKVREQLELYCGQDTEGMVWVMQQLRLCPRPLLTMVLAARCWTSSASLLPAGAIDSTNQPPQTPCMEQRRNRGVRCTRFVVRYGSVCSHSIDLYRSMINRMTAKTHSKAKKYNPDQCSNGIPK